MTDGGRQLQRLQCLRRLRVVHRPLELPDVDPGHRCDPVGAERLLDDNRPTRDHDQPGVDRERRRERRRLDAPAWSSGTSGRDVNTGAWGGSTLAQGQQWFNTGLEGSANINSQIYGIQIVCTQNNWSLGGCALARHRRGSRSPGSNSQGTENSAPYRHRDKARCGRAGRTCGIRQAMPSQSRCTASDVSGICSSGADVGSNGELNGPVGAAGRLGLAAVPQPGELVVQRRHPIAGADRRILPNRSQRDQRRRGWSTPRRRPCPVDNDPVGVSFRTPNDANPSVWVNHAVTVDATPTRRPFRRRGDELQHDDASAKSYPASGADGQRGRRPHRVLHRVEQRRRSARPAEHRDGTRCRSTSTRRRRPLTFAAAEPGRSDRRWSSTRATTNRASRAARSRWPRPARSDWTSLPTELRRLASPRRTSMTPACSGAYAFRATACDNVGNCASTTEQLALPLRAASDSAGQPDEDRQPAATPDRPRTGPRRVALGHGSPRTTSSCASSAEDISRRSRSSSTSSNARPSASTPPGTAGGCGGSAVRRAYT